MSKPKDYAWECRMCRYLLTKKSPGVPHRRCPHCGCHFDDLNGRWRLIDPPAAPPAKEKP